jgi:hypothetical protein
MGGFMMSDKSGDEPRDEGAWKNKVRSLDGTLKSLRTAAPKAKTKASKPSEPAKEHAPGLFRFRNAKT